MTPTQLAWTGPNPDQIAAWNLVQAGHLIGRRFYREFSKNGLTPTQFGVLLQLHLHPDMTNNHIARSVLVTPQSMSELLDSLQSLGLVERDAAPGRGRRVAIRLTDVGTERLQQCSEAVGRVQESLGLTEQNHHDLNHLLTAVLATAT